MTIKVGINGYGRIGRNILRAVYESNYRQKIQIVAVNDLGDAKLNAHLTQYDSVHGRFPGEVSLDNNDMIINGDTVRIFNHRDPAQIPWASVGVDVVLECTGLFVERKQAAAHLQAGAKKVIISAPGKQVDATIVYGVNHHLINSDTQIISSASCTTNCLAPIAKVLNDTIGIESGIMTTIHSYTNDQRLTDVYHQDIYRARSATQSMIPTKTGAANAVGLVLPELQGKLDGMAVRVPTANVSLIDFSFVSSKKADVAMVNQAIEQAANNELAGVLKYNTLPLVSIDFNHDPASSSFDATQTKVQGRLVKVMAWYDNEWGFSNRMLDNTVALMAV